MDSAPTNDRFAPEAASRKSIITISAFHSEADIAHQICHVRKVPILLQKSKIEQREKSRESRSRGFSAAESLIRDPAEIRGRFWMKRYGPSQRRA
jgi:hypothetical protein